MTKAKKVVGWREWITLPDLQVNAIRVKVDTGAKTSALHAEKIEIVKVGKNKKKFVRFILKYRRGRHEPVYAMAPLVGFRKVKSSVGHVTERPVIRTKLRLGKETWSIEVTLINRDIMGFRMLLGRSALQHGFLVDPAQSYLLPRPRPLR